MDPAIFSLGVPVLGICYGQQLMAHLLGGEVRKGEKGEYGLATLELDDTTDPMFGGLGGTQQIWMSHRDVVGRVPEGFSVAGRTDTCAVAAMAAPGARALRRAVPPEVVHTTRGKEYLANFVFRRLRVPQGLGRRAIACRCSKQEIRDCVGDRSVFFFVSGGVDSSVAFALCTRALGADRVRGVYVDTGLMREGETDFVRRMAGPHGGARRGAVSDARWPASPIRSRSATSSAKSSCACRSASSNRAGLLDENWILGQGTIYPDTIESGGTAKAALIKTHHNRVAGIQKLIESGRIVEPLKSFYKDEVREVGRELGLPAELLDRHPFPGPGLAIRCLCSEFDAPVRETRGGIHRAGEFGGRAGRFAQLRAGAGHRRAGSRARHGTDQPALRRQSRDRAGGDARAGGGDARCARVR